jgi:putative copper export protein
MLWIDTVVHWVHLLAACAWVGGLLFASLVLAPAVRELPAEHRRSFMRRAGKRFSRLGWIALLLLIATGSYKVFQLWDTLDWFDSPLGVALFLKLAAVSATVLLSALHDFVWGPKLAAMDPHADPAAFGKAQRRLVFWARVTAVLALAIVFAGAFLRTNPM